MASLDNLLGMVLFFTICGLALRYINDNKIRAVAFFSALLASAGMAGFIKVEHLEALLHRISQTADPIGVGLSGFVMSVGMLSPIPQLRKPLVTSGATGMAASLLGIPVWVTWLLIFLAIGIVAYLLYRAAKPLLQRVLGGEGDG